MIRRIAGLLLVVVCGGCAEPVLDVPPEIAEVEANRTSFFQSEDDPLLNVEPGTVIDDLAGLDGCWGYALEGRSDYAGFFFNAEFIRFDFESGEVLRQVLSRTGLIAFVDSDVYALVLDSETNTLTLDLLEVSEVFSYSDSFLGLESSLRTLLGIPEPEPQPAPEPFVNPDDANPFDLSITLDGDVFVITGSTADPVKDVGFPFVEGTIYKRFDCPQPAPSN